MQHQGGLVEFPTRKPLANLLLGGIALFAISFVATWYRVWWDSIIGLVVTILGYYSIRNENLVPMGLSFDMVRPRAVCWIVLIMPGRLDWFQAYFGSILSFLLHGVAFGIIAGELSVKHVLTIVKLDNPPPPGLLIFVLVVELILLGYSQKRHSNGASNKKQLTKEQEAMRQQRLVEQRSFEERMRSQKNPPQPKPMPSFVLAPPTFTLPSSSYVHH
ncbi:hypothetical protein DYB25_003137 [Aphanomyces astaci]|uniref:Transmembrane protein n=1 Tax=Aphanomyces astaci TaxID=112090 RepID=A0A396ZP97_APHAT|nr:hypothetical protein DYB25_003137 [Aphanomyces astaci]RHY81160.1 hypothetical protein DYB31_006466 [Aphanomyces astaci]